VNPFNPRKDTNPGYLYLAAFLFEREPENARLMLQFADQVVFRRRWCHEWPKAPTMSRLFRAALDKAKARQLPGLSMEMASLFKWALESDLRDLECAAAIESGRTVSYDVEAEDIEKIRPLLLRADRREYSGFYWLEKDDREVRAHL
jgi:hypothetical protein